MPPRSLNNRRLCRSLIAAIAATLVGCRAPNTVSVPQSGAQLQGNPSVVIVTQTSGRVAKVYLPAIARDSLIGWLDEPRSDQPPTSRIAIGVSDIQQISSTQATHGVTRDLFGVAAMIVIPAAVFVGIALILFFSGGNID